MYNILKYITLPLLILFLNACSLEEEAFDFVTPSNFYENKNDALAGLYASYSAIAESNYYGNKYYFLSEYPSDAFVSDGISDDDLGEYVWNPLQDNFYNVWTAMYKAINQANTVIDRVPGINSADLPQELKTEIIAEARFLRAMTYFNLIRMWGNVPYVEHEVTGIEGLDHGNENTAPKVWNLIMEDLKFAETHLPDEREAAERGRASKWIAKGLLAKVYLQRSGLAQFSPVPANWAVDGVNEWQLAVEKAAEITQSGHYQLLDDFNQVFDVENSAERIFELQYLPNVEGLGSEIPIQLNPDGSLAQGRSFGIGRTTPEFMATWDTTDARFNRTFLLEYTSASNGETYAYPEILLAPYIEKYRVSDGSEDLNGMNFTILRYADVLLMHSEAANESGTGDPYFGLNAVRQRAGLAPLSGLTQAELREAIRNERIMELCFEGHSFADYQRWGIIEERAARLGYELDNTYYLYPIPANEIMANPDLMQNPGY